MLSAVNVSPCPVARNEPKWGEQVHVDFQDLGSEYTNWKGWKMFITAEISEEGRSLVCQTRQTVFVFFCSKLHFLKCFWLLPTVLWLSWCHRYLSIKISVFIASQLIQPGMSVLLLRVATHSTPSEALKSYTSRRQAGKYDYFQPAFISPELVAGSICRRGRQYFQWINWEGSRCFVHVRNSAGMLCNAFSMSFPNVPGAKHSLKPSSQTATGRSPPTPRTHFYLQ